MNQPSAMKRGNTTGSSSPWSAARSASGAASVAARISHPGRCPATRAASACISASGGRGSEGWPWATMMADRLMGKA